MFGGIGTIWGTVLGLFTLAILKNGLSIAALPSELTGVLTGALLVSTIALDHFRRSERRVATHSPAAKSYRVPR